MARSKLTMPRWPADITRMARGRRGRRIYPYKIKLTLPEQKTVNIKKNGQVTKTINVRKKSKYFSTRSARMFLTIEIYFYSLITIFLISLTLFFFTDGNFHFIEMS